MAGDNDAVDLWLLLVEYHLHQFIQDGVRTHGRIHGIRTVPPGVSNGSVFEPTETLL